MNSLTLVSIIRNPLPIPMCQTIGGTVPSSYSAAPKIMHAQEVAQVTQTATRSKNVIFCGLPARTFETQEVENLTARIRKKLKI